MNTPHTEAVPSDAPVLWQDEAEGVKRPKSDKPKEILKLLSRSRRHAILYGAEHPVVLEVLRDLHEFLQGHLSSRPSVKVFVHEGTFFVEGTVLLEDSLKYDSLLTALTERDIGVVKLDAGVEPGELQHLIGVLNLKAEEVQRLGGAGAYLKEHGVQHITVGSTKAAGTAKRPGSGATAGPSDGRGEGGQAGRGGQGGDPGAPASPEPLAMKVDPQDVYRTGLRVMNELTYQAAKNQPLDMRKAQKVINYFIDIMAKDGAVPLGVASLRSHDEDTYHHSLNVCVLSLLIGSQLNLERTLLTTLGLAALLHDIGKVRVPQELLTRPAKLAPAEEEIVRRHTIYGAHTLRELPDLLRLAMVVAFEHHANYNLSGYPRITAKPTPHLLTRIVQVADVFDAATSARRAYRRPKRPAEALGVILEGAGTLFDPVVARLAVRVLADVYAKASRSPQRAQSPDHASAAPPGGPSLAG